MITSDNLLKNIAIPKNSSDVESILVAFSLFTKKEKQQIDIEKQAILYRFLENSIKENNASWERTSNWSDSVFEKDSSKKGSLEVINQKIKFLIDLENQYNKRNQRYFRNEAKDITQKIFSQTNISDIVSGNIVESKHKLEALISMQLISNLVKVKNSFSQESYESYVKEYTELFRYFINVVPISTIMRFKFTGDASDKLIRNTQFMLRYIPVPESGKWIKSVANLIEKTSAIDPIMIEKITLISARLESYYQARNGGQWLEQSSY